MKNQALTITLAVLLAVSLSAIVALVVSSEVIGAPTAADAPTAINVTVPPSQPVVDAPAVAPPATAPNTDTGQAPVAPAETDAVAADADPDTGDTDADADADTDDTDADAGDADEDTGDADADTDTDDEDADADDAGEDAECVGGTIIDGECVINPIDCLLGYAPVGNECVFIGCPAGYQLNGDICKPLAFEAPCEAGFVRVGGVCVETVIVDPDLIINLCPPGEHIAGGVCVPDFQVNPDFVLEGLELAAGG